jgi:hypothetical protein
MKRKTADTKAAAANDTTASSPYEARSKSHEEWRKSYDSPYLVLSMTDIFESMPDIYDENDELLSPEDWSSEQRKERLDALTQAEVAPTTTLYLFPKLRTNCISNCTKQLPMLTHATTPRIDL